MKTYRWFGVSLLVIFVDQYAKWLAENILEYQQPVLVMPMFNLRLIHNTGAAFSFLSDAGGWQRWFFTVLSLAISTVIGVWLWRLRDESRVLAGGLSMILGGAIGNVIDRIHLGYVVDFIDVYYQQWHWPVFNMADFAISIGVILILLDMLRPRHATS